jgi:hypothetical protein
VGKVVQALQSVNYHDSRTHGHEWYGPFLRLVGFGWVGSAGFESSRSGSWYAASVNPVCMFWFGYKGGVPVSIGHFWLQV